MARHDEWFRLYDSSPVADVELGAPYRKEISDDHGATWECPRDTTGEHLKLDVAEALLAGLAVDVRGGTVTFLSPHPRGGLIRYTPTR
ncbi:hypothetical protein [Streptomyces sp. NPDC101115]|uniref:hypothetical protein n=1 Tax=Streptomyces sp. NPDC101115 TaxID=3366106 RepID=UPI00382A0EDE